MKKKIQTDNRGLTLIELIVALSICVIILGSIWQFIITSTKSYSSQKDHADLQVEVQQTMNQLQNLFVDANRSVAYVVGSQEVGNDSEHANPAEAATKTLNIYSDNKVIKIEWNKDTEQVTYQEFKVTNGNIETPAAGVADEGEEAAENTVEVLAEGITEFSADVSKVETNQIVKLKLTCKRGNATYEDTRNITLRNHLLASNNVSDIYASDFTPAGAATTTVQIVPNSEMKLSQRASYDFNATITTVDGENTTTTNAGKMKIIWTIGNQTSKDTSIDIESGMLSIGADETVGNEITVTATLASDRRVKASTTVGVLLAVPEITIEKAPKYVLRGESYASSYAEGRPIQVTVKNAAEDDYILSVDENAVKAGIRVDGKSIVIPNKFSSAMGENFQFTLTATTVENVNVFDSVVVNVRNPEFKVVASAPESTTKKYMRGETVALSADWSKSEVPLKDPVGSTEIVYEDAVYEADDLAKTEIGWTYEYKTQSGEMKKVEVASGVNNFTVPTDIETSNAQIMVTGVSKKYHDVSSQNQIVYIVDNESSLAVADVEVSITATANGSDYTAGQTISNVLVGSTIALRGDVLLYTNPQIEWSVYEVKSSGTNLTNVIAVNTLSNTRQDANIVVNSSQLTNILGKTFVIRVTDINSGIYKEVTFTVQDKLSCDAVSPDYKGEYLVVTNGSQKPFDLPVRSGIPFTNASVGNWPGVQTGTKPLETKADSNKRVVTFTPTTDGAAEGTLYTYDLDSDYTGQHLLRAELTRKNANLTIDSFNFYLPHIPNGHSDTLWNDKDSINSYKGKFINFYGDSRDLNDKDSYIVEYSFKITDVTRRNCYITITLQDGTKYTKHYIAKLFAYPAYIWEVETDWKLGK